jgi:hypothetical protein
MENVLIGDETDLLSIPNNIISFPLINLLNRADGPSARSNLPGSSGAGISLINSINLISHIKHKETIRSLVHEHHIISKLQLSIMAISHGYPLEAFCELLLREIDHEFSLVFLVEVVALIVLVHIDFFRPVAHACLARVLGPA